MQVNTRVVLPMWIWTDSKDKSEFKKNLSYYMRRYPGYQVVEVHRYYAICNRN